MSEIETVAEFLKNKAVGDFVMTNLNQSLRSIGFSDNFVDDLLRTLDHINPNDFGVNHKDELKKVYTIGFFQKIVLEYFQTEIIPLIPPSDKVLDIGCGTGILAKKLSENESLKEIIGIDINSYPEWKDFQNNKIKYEVVPANEFEHFLQKENPGTVVLTWTLHHMEFNEQERCLRQIHTNLSSGSKVIILEDSYSENILPEKGLEIYDNFIVKSAEERLKIMSVLCWTANRILAQRDKVPIPHLNNLSILRTVEEYEQLFTSVGFKTATKKFIGFPEKRDINTPQSIFVLEK